MTHPQADRFNPVYEQFGHSFQLYANCFFLIIFVICIVTGFFLNSKSFRGYQELTRDTGHQSDFATKYGMPLCLINIGTVGLFFLFYLDIIMIYTEGAGFTGATIGVILAGSDLYLYGTASKKYLANPCGIPAALPVHPGHLLPQ